MNWEWGVPELGVGRINENNLLNTDWIMQVKRRLAYDSKFRPFKAMKRR